MAIFAAIQMTSCLSPGLNFLQVKKFMLQAAGQGAKCLVLPEYFACLPQKLEDLFGLAEHPGRGRIQDFLAHSAEDLGVYVAGDVPILAGEKIRHTLMLYSPEGKKVLEYQRENLFNGDTSPSHGGFGLENTVFEAGNLQQPKVVDTTLGRIGLCLGFDLRFPAFFQGLRAAGAEIILAPASMSYALGDAHWHILLGARAIDQQCFVVAANQYGLHDNNEESFGDSLILDPWGNVLALKEQGVGGVWADLNPVHLEVLREEFPLNKV